MKRMNMAVAQIIDSVNVFAVVANSLSNSSAKGDSEAGVGGGDINREQEIERIRIFMAQVIPMLPHLVLFADRYSELIQSTQGLQGAVLNVHDRAVVSLANMLTIADKAGHNLRLSAQEITKFSDLLAGVEKSIAAEQMDCYWKGNLH